MNRREFLLAAGAAAVTPGCASAGRNVASGSPLKVCVFADIHYFPGFWVNDRVEFLDEIMNRAAEERCDFMIHLGDMVHRVRETEERAYVKRYNEFRAVKGYHVLGNHEHDRGTWQEACELYRMPNAYHWFERGGFRFIIADPNYVRDAGGRFIHHGERNYLNRAADTTINWIPPEQMEWLRDAVMGSELPCVVLSHQSFMSPPCGAGVMNKDEVQAIFREANARRPKHVRLVINGHNHKDRISIMDGIPYWDVNSANFQYFGTPHGAYPAEYVAAHPRAVNNLGWTRPLSAILSLHSDGRIEIKGSEAQYLFGVDPAAAGLKEYDAVGRRTAPRIQDVRIG